MRRAALRRRVSPRWLAAAGCTAGLAGNALQPQEGWNPSLACLGDCGTLAPAQRSPPCPRCGIDTTPPTLLERLRGGSDEAAWSRVVRLYAPLLFAWARRCGETEADAADLAQEVFLTLLRTLPTFEYDRHAGRFGLAVDADAQQAARDRKRREVRQDRVLAQRGPEPDLPDVAEAFWEGEYRQELARLRPGPDAGGVRAEHLAGMLGDGGAGPALRRGGPRAGPERERRLHRQVPGAAPVAAGAVAGCLISRDSSSSRSRSQTRTASRRGSARSRNRRSPASHSPTTTGAGVPFASRRTWRVMLVTPPIATTSRPGPSSAGGREQLDDAGVTGALHEDDDVAGRHGRQPATSPAGRQQVAAGLVVLLRHTSRSPAP